MNNLPTGFRANSRPKVKRVIVEHVTQKDLAKLRGKRVTNGVIACDPKCPERPCSNSRYYTCTHSRKYGGL